MSAPYKIYELVINGKFHGNFMDGRVNAGWEPDTRADKE